MITHVCSLSANQEVVILAVDGTGLVSEAQKRHKTLPTATAALGRALLGSLLMCCFRKDNESLQITFRGQGPLKGMQVIAESNGFVKGKVGNVLCDLPIREDGKVDVGRAVGPGVVPCILLFFSLPSLITAEIAGSHNSGSLACYRHDAHTFKSPREHSLLHLQLGFVSSGH
jgi:Hsp33 protein